MAIKSPGEYREEARRVREMVAHMTREDMRQTAHEIADLYERLADDVEALARREAPGARPSPG
jgi:hypothetical protein